MSVQIFPQEMGLTFVGRCAGFSSPDLYWDAAGTESVDRVCEGLFERGDSRLSSRSDTSCYSFTISWGADKFWLCTLATGT